MEYTRNIIQRIFDYLLLTRHSVHEWLERYVTFDVQPFDQRGSRVMGENVDRKGVAGSYSVLLVLFGIIFTTPIVADLLFGDLSYLDKWTAVENRVPNGSRTIEWLLVETVVMLAVSAAVLTWIIFATISGACYCAGWVISRVDYRGGERTAQAMKGLRAVYYPIISVVIVSRQMSLTATVGVSVGVLAIGDIYPAVSDVGFWAMGLFVLVLPFLWSWWWFISVTHEEERWVGNAVKLSLLNAFLFVVVILGTGTAFMWCNYILGELQWVAKSIVSDGRIPHDSMLAIVGSVMAPFIAISRVWLPLSKIDSGRGKSSLAVPQSPDANKQSDAHQPGP